MTMIMPSIKDYNVTSGDKIDLQEGQIYSLCSCGLSEKLPFCDGTHTEKAPEFKSIKVEIKRGGQCKIY